MKLYLTKVTLRSVRVTKLIGLSDSRSKLACYDPELSTYWIRKLN